MGKNEKRALVATLACLIFMLVGWFTEKSGLSGSWVFFTVAIVSGGFKQTSEGIQELLTDKTVNVDLLMALAAIGACLTCNWFEGSILTFIFCLS